MVAKTILKTRPSALYLRSENRRENISNPIRTIPNSSHTAGVGAANRTFPIRNLAPGEKDGSKAVVTRCGILNPGWESNRARDVPLLSREL